MINVFLVFLVGFFCIILFAVWFVFEFNKNQKLKKFVITKYNEIFDDQKIPTDYTGEFDVKLGVNKTPTKLVIEDDLLHSDDGPSYIDDIVNRWHHKGLLHRIDGPAFISPNRTESFYVRGFYFDDEKKYWNNELVKLTAINKLF